MQKTTLAMSIDCAELKARYDAASKKFLAEKRVLAWIMKHSMEEYHHCTVEEIAEKYIEGTPQISKVAVLPDDSIEAKIPGIGVEDISITEGTVTYDIRFNALLPMDGNTVTMVVNLEAQDDFYPGYPLTKRGIFYGGRMISSQYGTVFTNAHYEKMRKVYSIWICMNPPKYRQNSITKYAMTEENVVGNVKENRENYDLITIVMICLGDSSKEEENVLLAFLNTLFSGNITVTEKKHILENKFGIAMTEKMEKEVEGVSNLGDGIERRGIRKGIEQGMEQGRRIFIVNMLKHNMEIQEICDLAECDVAYVEEIQKNMRETV